MAHCLPGNILNAFTFEKGGGCFIIDLYCSMTTFVDFHFLANCKYIFSNDANNYCWGAVTIGGNSCYRGYNWRSRWSLFEDILCSGILCTQRERDMQTHTDTHVQHTYTWKQFLVSAEQETGHE